MAYSSGFHPHPRISYAGAAPTGLGERGGVPRDRAGRGRRPRRRRTQRSPRRCPTGSTSLRSWSRPAGRWPTCSRPAAGGPSCPARPRPGRSAVAAFLAADAVPGRADDQEGAARVRLPRGGRLAGLGADGRGTELDLVLRHTVPAVRPDDVLTGLAAVAGADPTAATTGAAADPAGPGSARRDDGRGRGPARRRPRRRLSGPGVRYSATVDVRRHPSAGAPDPTTFSPVPLRRAGTWVRGRHQTATRPDRSR